MLSDDCWFLTGPTASGKSAVALELASRANAEIIAMDSMTLYRKMDIGTAKPTEEDRQRIRHHLIDVLDPSESASVEWYLRQAAPACDEIRSRGRQPLLVGGTPLYLKACLRGLFEGPPADKRLRADLEAQAERQGAGALHERLAMFDPSAAKRIRPGDVRRIVRALEVYQLTGRPISSLQQQFSRPALPAPPVACLIRPRPELRERIHRRVVSMLEDGWVHEVRDLLAHSPTISRQAAQAVGFAEIGDFISEKCDYDEMVNRIVNRSRQFCKRQMTWFRHIEECHFFEIQSGEPVSSVVERVHEFFIAKRPQLRSH